MAAAIFFVGLGGVICTSVLGMALIPSNYIKILIRYLQEDFCMRGGIIPAVLLQYRCTYLIPFRHYSKFNLLCYFYISNTFLP